MAAVGTKKPPDQTPGLRSRNKRELIPRDSASVTLMLGSRAVALTNLQKPFWPDLGITKGDLLRYYAVVSPYLLPHLIDRAMVMKRYPNGAVGDFLCPKCAPTSRPDWIEK